MQKLQIVYLSRYGNVSGHHLHVELKSIYHLLHQNLSVITSIPIFCATDAITVSKFFVALHNGSVSRQAAYIAEQKLFTVNSVTLYCDAHFDV